MYVSDWMYKFGTATGPCASLDNDRMQHDCQHLTHVDFACVGLGSMGYTT